MPFQPLTGWECRTIPVADARPLLGFEVVGDSMVPQYLPGDVAICDRLASPIIGEPAVVKLATGEVVVKIWRQMGNYIFLQSVNPTGANFEELTPEDIAWAAPVVALWREMRKR